MSETIGLRDMIASGIAGSIVQTFHGPDQYKRLGAATVAKRAYGLADEIIMRRGDPFGEMLPVDFHIISIAAGMGHQLAKVGDREFEDLVEKLADAVHAIAESLIAYS